MAFGCAHGGLTILPPEDLGALDPNRPAHCPYDLKTRRLSLEVYSSCTSSNADFIELKIRDLNADSGFYPLLQKLRIQVFRHRDGMISDKVISDPFKVPREVKYLVIKLRGSCMDGEPLTTGDPYVCEV